MTTLFAQPYDISANGFYFEDFDSYQEKAAKCLNEFGDPVEEFEIQFIDDEVLDCDLATAISLSQANLAQFFELCELDEWEKQALMIAVGECGYELDDISTDIGGLDIEIHELDSFRDLAEQFVDDGLFGDIPESLARYFDYDALARDLEIEYSSVRIGNRSFIYRAG